MNSSIPRLMLAASAAIFAFGGVMHAVAYSAKALYSINGSNLSPFLASEIKVLWLADTTTLIGLALVFGFIAAKPTTVTRIVIVMLAVIPAGTTLLLYLFLGPFYAGHMLLAACAMVVISGLLMPATNTATKASA